MHQNKELEIEIEDVYSTVVLGCPVTLRLMVSQLWDNLARRKCQAPLFRWCWRRVATAPGSGCVAAHCELEILVHFPSAHWSQSDFSA